MNPFEWWLTCRELKSKNDLRRQHAMERIAGSGRPAAFGLLVQGLDDPYQGVQVAAIQGLAATHGPVIIDVLRRLTGDANHVVAYQAGEALLQFGDAVVAVFGDLLSSPITDVREDAAAKLQLRGFSESALGSVLKQMLAAFPTGTRNVRCCLAVAMGLTRNPAAVDALALALQDADTNLRVRAILALGRIADDRAAAALRGYSAQSETEREALQEALMRLPRAPYPY